MKEIYESPLIEIIEVQVELGFANSQLPGVGDGEQGW